MFQLYLLGLYFALAEVAAAARVDMAGVEHILAARLALQTVDDFNDRLSHLCVDAATRRSDLRHRIVMAVHVCPRRSVAGGRPATLDAQS